MNASKQKIIDIAKSLGFDLVGFTPANPLKEATEKLKTWLAMGYNHNMSYMERNLNKREDVCIIMPEAKSVISLAVNYYKDEEFSGRNNTGKVSKYAWGKDYHFVLWEKLETLKAEIISQFPEAKLISYVDTGPVMDKVWAVKAGLGWMGKHTNIISKEIGSWFFIATVITNLEFEYDKPIADFCGTCTACIDACPTKAIVAPYVLDAGRCISNLTIENKGAIPEEFKGKFENWIFGCDICQDVCPWNGKFSKTASVMEFLESTNKEIDLEDITLMTSDVFKVRFSESPIMRTKLKGLKRNGEFLQRSE